MSVKEKTKSFFGNRLLLTTTFSLAAASSIEVTDYASKHTVIEEMSAQRHNQPERIEMMGTAARLIEDCDSLSACTTWENFLTRHEIMGSNLDNIKLFQEWMEPLLYLQYEGIRTKAEMVDSAVDNTVTYGYDSPYQLSSGSDDVEYGEDYWSTIYETLKTKIGDCEDIAIQKYYTLRELDVPASKMFLIFVESGNQGLDHMALIVDVSNDIEPCCLAKEYFILNNGQSPGILIPENESGFKLHYAMNENGIWSVEEETYSMGKNIAAKSVAKAPSPKAY